MGGHTVTRPKATFCTGHIVRHVVVMAGTGAIGLMAVFIVDLLNLFYISWLGDPALTAAIGFSGVISYVQIAVSIGLSIGIGAITGRLIGAGKMEQAQRVASSFGMFMMGACLVIGLFTAWLATPLLALLGAKGEAARQATLFLEIVSPGLPLIAAGMGCSGLLRAIGAARISMNVTLMGAMISAIADPLLIVVMGLGLKGAAISTILSRLAVALVGFRCARRHGLLALPVRTHVMADTRLVGQVAMPAILTNLATPVGSVFVTHAMASFGLAAIAGQATIDRIVPVAFAFVFALTGSVGPIMSQNLGAGKLDRVRDTLVASLWLVAGCVAITWAVLFMAQDIVVRVFSAQGTAAMLIHLFCNWTIAGYVFIGMLFVANSAFNNLGFPLYSTLFNWGRATLGTIPFVWFGMQFGPAGVQVGQVLGCVLFGSCAVMTAFGVVRRLHPGDRATEPAMPDLPPAQTGEAGLIELDELDHST
ncbi:MATE family efflux transporter [Komagataeibacter oboediens]|uniref:Multidrug transporter n=1 Tax=Komagataeibacter oboediens TaxID=65958 RepID=A0ABS5SLQ3_9PROT|nr:MATE family efflux transporter [Komagataeibacter oboediens]MBL7234292.1 polysaccharide biosynthesis C-terminal domain-containing protein [Komagataeibacter oboediens]MBT0674405.1 multidrug transporter [Komagataeibacter oboediens]MBT0678056.1 multidrug transporter [Komagataeibacter oboediens]MBV1822671.1 polysaccharide biosynthesis C-terminal domain-containing protein [Komagataeibacter oboediens]